MNQIWNNLIERATLETLSLILHFAEYLIN